MKKPAVWIVIACAAAFGLIMYSSFRGLTGHRVEVCIEFDGREACRTASASSEKQAERTAIENACAQLTSGMTNSIACQNTPPKSRRVLSRE
jgi:hypothetical protein